VGGKGKPAPLRFFLKRSTRRFFSRGNGRGAQLRFSQVGVFLAKKKEERGVLRMFKSSMIRGKRGEVELLINVHKKKKKKTS